VKVPLLSIDLPLLGFYVTAPAIYLVLHFYMLVQVRLMADKVLAFLAAAERKFSRGSLGWEGAVKRLDSFSVVQLLVLQRLNRRSLAVRAIVWATLSVIPVTLLLFVQIRFLPYHSEMITWWHRVIIATDLILLWWLWPRGAKLYRTRSVFGWLGILGAALACLLVAFFSVGLATIPGESADGLAAHVPGTSHYCRLRARIDRSASASRPGAQSSACDRPGAESVLVLLRRSLFDGAVDPTSQQPASLFTRRLVLLDEDLVPENDAARAEMRRTRTLRGRDLRYAVLDRADLRKADLTGAVLEGASLEDAQLDEAILNNAKLLGASMSRARLPGASLLSADMRGVDLRGAALQGAELGCAQLRGARFQGAQLQGASLDAAGLQGADFMWARLQGASLRGAELHGANFEDAWLQGATLQKAQLQGASLTAKDLRGTNFDGASVWRAIRDSNPKVFERAAIKELSFDSAAPEGVEDEPSDSGCPPQAPGRVKGIKPTWEFWAAAWVSDLKRLQKQFPAIEVPSFTGLTTAQNAAKEEQDKKSWLAAKPLADSAITGILLDLACDAEDAPHVARGVIRQYEIGLSEPARSLDDATAKRFVARLSNAASCPGAMGLSAGDRSTFGKIRRNYPF
jgi:uncharacterized protein YjbI with pentapeptide repeats